MASAEDTPMLPDPPDGKDGSLNLHASFKDKLLAGKGRFKDTSRVDLISNNLFRIEYEDGDRLKPRSCPKPKVSGSNSQSEPNRGNNHDDIGNQGSAHSTALDPQDQLHGEWLVVSRSRKSGAQKGKGKAKISPFDSRDQTEKVKTGNKVNQVSNTSENQVASQGNVVFSSKPSVPSRTNKIGKKRSRIEIKSAPEGKGSSSASKDITQKSSPHQVEASNKSNRKEPAKEKPSSSVIFKPDPSKPKSLFDFGIKTAIIEPHRLRFKDEEILQNSLDDKVGVFLQPPTMTEENKDSETDSEMDGEPDNSNANSDSDMNEEPTDQIKSGLVQPPWLNEECL
ncbi:hypothetical protein SESBI_36175 [Sesbania bispinosa]|nr:hypothetical protein SESBI_36175 [Sesbania bispinosa]